MNNAKVRLALTMLEQALNEPTPNPRPRRIVQERFFTVGRIRYDSDALKLRPHYGAPQHADVRIVMEYDRDSICSGRVIDFEIIK